MATQGIVSIVDKDNKVLMKVVAGCEGYSTRRLADRLVKEWPVDPIVAYDLAGEEKFGCNACLFVITEDSILGMDEDTHELRNCENSEDYDFSLFRSTFQKPSFNPRWENGTADYVQVINIEKEVESKVATTRSWVCQVRPGDPHHGGRLGPEDFFRPEKVTLLDFERGIEVAAYNPLSRTIILRDKEFCVVKESLNPKWKKGQPYVFHICLPRGVGGREVVFYSPSINPLSIR